MKCPYCQKDMEEGYVPFNSPFILKWVSLVDKQKVRISDKIKWSKVAKIKNIHYCKDCGVFIKKILGFSTSSFSDTRYKKPECICIQVFYFVS